MRGHGPASPAVGLRPGTAPAPTPPGAGPAPTPPGAGPAPAMRTAVYGRVDSRSGPVPTLSSSAANRAPSLQTDPAAAGVTGNQAHRLTRRGPLRGKWWHYTYRRKGKCSEPKSVNKSALILARKAGFMTSPCSGCAFLWRLGCCIKSLVCHRTSICEEQLTSELRGLWSGKFSPQLIPGIKPSSD